MRCAEETRACHFHSSSPICTTLLWWLLHTAEMIGMPPTKLCITYTLWPVNGTLHQIAFCLVRRKLLQICMTTSNPGCAAWACRCPRHQAGERMQPTRLTTAPAGFSCRPTRAEPLPPTRCLVPMIFICKGYTEINPLYVKLLGVNLHVFMFHTLAAYFTLVIRNEHKISGNYLQEFHCYSPSKQWQVFHHCRAEDGWAVSAFPWPRSSSWAGKWLKKARPTLSRPRAFYWE